MLMGKIINIGIKKPIKQPIVSQCIRHCNQKNEPRTIELIDNTSEEKLVENTDNLLQENSNKNYD